MAVKVAIVNNGNFTTAATWGTVDSTSYLNAENATESLLTTNYSDTRSAAFTPGAIEISHIGVKLCERMGTTGTMSVQLELDSDNSQVAGTEVTINTADLPAATETGLDGGWVLLKLSSPVTLLAATAYQIAAKTSSATQVDLWCDSTADNLSRILVTTTTGAPGAGDDLIIAEEKTGAGAATTINVVMNNNDTTDYGSAPTAANSLITPGISICDGGSLSFVTAASSELQLSNSLIVYSGGTLNIGTAATPVERGQTAKLHFDMGTNVDYGLIVRNGGTFNAQGLSRTSGKNIYYGKLNVDTVNGESHFHLDTDSGWLSGDTVAIASTSRTAADCETKVLDGNAGAEVCNVTAAFGATVHSGTSPTQAEVILLTRNVQIYGASDSLQGYVVFTNGSTADIDWIEFKWLGSGTASKRGIELTGNSTTSVNIQYSSLHDFTVTSSWGFSSTGGASSWTFSNNVAYAINNLAFQTAATSGTWTADSNIFMRNVAASTNLVSLSDIGGTFTNNTMVGGTSSGLALAEAAGTVGTMSGNTSHSNTSVGLTFSNAIQNSTISTMTIWRNSGVGMSLASSTSDVIFDTFTLFGNTTSNITMASTRNVKFKSLVSNGDTTFSTTNGIQFNTSTNISEGLCFYSADFSTVAGIKTAHTNDINLSSTFQGCGVILQNSKLGAGSEVASQTNLTLTGIVGSERTDTTKGAHRAWKKYGSIAVDTTAGLFKTGSPSVRLTPNNASNRLESGSFKVNVVDGQTCTPSVFFRASIAGDGTDYTSTNAIRLVLKRNDAIGITSDTVIDSAVADDSGNWIELTDTTAAATDDGVMEFVIDCDGTAGWVNVDDFTATVA